MPSTSPREKAIQKAEAKGILNGLLAFVESVNFDPATHLQPIKDAAVRILAIDPLLISTAAIVLRKMQVPMNENYQMMGDKYHYLIKEYVAKEFDEISRRRTAGPIHAGLRDDIDEALSYPIELEGEIQAAKAITELQSGTPEAQAAQAFIDRIAELKGWLLALLKKNQIKLREAGLPVDEYIDMFEQKDNRVYCVTQTGPSFPGNVYTPFIDDLREIIRDVESYRQEEATAPRSSKIYRQQRMLNKLRGFLDHATARGYCQICLRDDIRAIAQADQARTFNVNQTFITIEEFLQGIYDADRNQAIKQVLDETVPALKKAIREKGCPVA